MLATECMEQLISWLKKGGNVGIHGEIVISLGWSQAEPSQTLQTVQGLEGKPWFELSLIRLTRLQSETGRASQERTWFTAHLPGVCL